MAKLVLRAGDDFSVRTNSLLAKLILIKQRVFALDDDADFNHSGIILNEQGDTYESLWRINQYHIDRYIGCPIVIARYKAMTPDRFAEGYKNVKQYKGNIYPFWRLPLHLFGMAQVIHNMFPVCSELVAEHCYWAGVHNARGWGWNPDHLSDLWEVSKHVDIIYKGIWKGVNK